MKIAFNPIDPKYYLFNMEPHFKWLVATVLGSADLQ